jgi:hypothetical protein
MRLSSYNFGSAKMKKFAVIVLILIPVVAFAQGVSDLRGKSYLSKDRFSLFDPSRLTMRQSYSFGYYSGGGTSGSIGYYLNSIEYAFSNPLKLRVDLGYLHRPTSLFSGTSSDLNSGVFIPAFAIDWRPSENFNFRFDYRHVPLGAYRGLNPYYNPYYQEDYR